MRCGSHVSAVSGVPDDPEGEQVWEETVAAWRALPLGVRERVDLATVPMDDPVENALVINALLRHASIVVQPSLAEGFGLTVAEAMWKSRPVVASSVGGIVDQVVDGETGLLVQDPRDLESFGAAIERLLRDPLEAGRYGTQCTESRGRAFPRRPPSPRLLRPDRRAHRHGVTGGCRPDERRGG